MSDNAPQKKLNTKQNKALSALIEGANQQEAAQLAGVHMKTVERWLNENIAFYAELRRKQTIALNKASTRLAGTLDMAVDVMREIMQDKSQPAGVRLRAANYAATHALRIGEYAEIAARLDELEAKVIAHNAQR